ncbi:MAG TPA: hypothetical protein VFQ22_07785 [Longimicrobiales bacterium]|nr:hypothetical protein [Longimicrobiales bacterium]
MAQCAGRTRKGERCKREATEGSDYCAIHLDQEVRPPRERAGERASEWDAESMLKAALGIGLVAAIFLYRFRR